MGTFLLFQEPLIRSLTLLSLLTFVPYLATLFTQFLGKVKTKKWNFCSAKGSVPIDQSIESLSTVNRQLNSKYLKLLTGPQRAIFLSFLIHEGVKLGRVQR